MKSRRVRHGSIGTGLLAAGLALSSASCVGPETAAQIADLAASTSGSFAEILARNYVMALFSHGVQPNLDAPISEQVK